jgi:hypothetical protein
MKKRIEKHIARQDYVRVDLTDESGEILTHFDGIIVEQTKKFILMVDTNDFHFEGLVVAKKADIAEIRSNLHDRFVGSIMESEGIKAALLQKRAEIPFSLGTFREMFENLQHIGMPVIIERLYGNNNVFQIGPIESVKAKRVFIDYINASGEYDLKPVSSRFKEITFFRFGDMYAHLFFKHSKRIV